MRKLSTPAGAVALIVTLGAGLAGCSQIAMLKGKMAFKEANALYQAENYADAAEKYEEVLAEGCPGGECQNEELNYAYFFLANSYDNMFRPARKGEPENDQNLTKAIEYYELAAEKVPDATYRKRALQFMAGVYGADKLGQPEKQEPVLQRLIDQDPSDVSTYYQMSRLFEDAGDYEKAESYLLKAREVKPDDPEVYGQLARYYESRNEFDKQVEAMRTRAEKEPDSPEAQYRIAAAYWLKACLPSRPQCEPIAAPANRRAEYIQAGLEASDKALSLREDYIDALVYKNLLLRSQTYLENNLARRNELLAQADSLLKKVQEIQERRKNAPEDTTAKSEE